MVCAMAAILCSRAECLSDAQDPAAAEVVPAGAVAAAEAVSRQLPVDLDLKDADIRDVARAFSRISGVNIIVSDDVSAKITLRVQSMDWRQALNMILGAYNITSIEEKDYIVITTLGKRRTAEEGGDLLTKVITLNFVGVENLQKTLQSMLTGRGKLEVDSRSNSLVVTDIAERIVKIGEVAVQLDTRTPQVMIEAMIVDVKLTDQDQMGIDWQIAHKLRPERSIETSQQLDLDTSDVTLNYGKTFAPWANFTGYLQLWAEDKKVNILANPRVLTLDNLTAQIEILEQIPYSSSTTTDQGTVTNTEFKDAGVKLYVKPHITKDNFVILNIKTEQSFRSGWTPDNQPVIDSRKAETNLMVKDGETIVIGGLRKKEDTTTVDKIPLLGDIPFVGALFRKTQKDKIDTELLIFITPLVTVEQKLTSSERAYTDKFSDMKNESSSLTTRDNSGSKARITIPYSLRPPE
jgi:type IV pilus assembly protein PilQ